MAENRNATYPELLSRFYTLLHVNNPELAGEKRRYTIVPPQVTREGTKKTSFANFVDICRRLHRQPEHVLMFLYAELGTQGSMDAAQRLILRGRFNQKQIENVLRKYIGECVCVLGVILVNPDVAGAAHRCLRRLVGRLLTPSRVRHVQDLQVA